MGCLNKKDILRKLCGFKGKEAALPLWQLLQPDLLFICRLGLVNNEDMTIHKMVFVNVLRAEEKVLSLYISSWDPSKRNTFQKTF